MISVRGTIKRMEYTTTPDSTEMHLTLSIPLSWLEGAQYLFQPALLEDVWLSIEPFKTDESREEEFRKVVNSQIKRYHIQALQSDSSLKPEQKEHINALIRDSAIVKI